MNSGPSDLLNDDEIPILSTSSPQYKKARQALIDYLRELRTQLEKMSPNDPNYQASEQTLKYYQQLLAYEYQTKQKFNEDEKEALLKSIWQKYGSPGIEGSVTSFSLLNTIYAIAVGGPSNHIQPTMQYTARALPLIAIITAIENLLESYESEKFVLARRLWKSTTAAVKNSAFLVAFFFFVITEIIQAEKHESSFIPVNINNYAASAVIITCLGLSLLGGMRIYFIEEDLHNQRSGIIPARPSLLRRGLQYLSCNRLTSRLMGFLTGIAAMHWLIYSLEEMLGILDTSLGKICRYLLTAYGGLPTILLGYAPGIERPFIYQTQIYISLLFTQLAATSLNAYHRFTGKAAKDFWEEGTLKEQFYFWLIAFPLFVLSIPLTIHVWKKCRPSEKDPHNSEVLPLYSPPPIQDIPARPLAESPKILPAYEQLSARNVSATSNSIEKNKLHNPLRI